MLNVAPHAGAWVETYPRAVDYTESHVAPHAGAWVETKIWFRTSINNKGRAPCGRVG